MCLRCLENSTDQPNMKEYLKVAPPPSRWQKLELKDLSISEPSEEIQFLHRIKKSIFTKQEFHCLDLQISKGCISLMLSCWADQYGSIDTSKTNICPLVTI